MSLQDAKKELESAKSLLETSVRWNLMDDEPISESDVKKILVHIVRALEIISTK